MSELARGIVSIVGGVAIKADVFNQPFIAVIVQLVMLTVVFVLEASAAKAAR